MFVYARINVHVFGYENLYWERKNYIRIYTLIMMQFYALRNKLR